ncbi:hypothetical protein ACLFLH_06885 [Mammaliicoccus sciuri]|uniref:hypothetical protein n=1 Tax=Mammaliicoccus sciuri TaxID=1296 RepID=UPI00397E540B
MPKGDWLVDAEEIKERMCIGEKFFRNHIVKDSRMKAFEIKKTNRKSWWPSDKAKDICIQIMYEYDA